MVSLLQGSDQIAQEAPRLIVILIQRQPGYRHSTTGDTRCHQGGLAKTSRGGNQGQRTAQPLRDLFLEPRPGDQLWPGEGQVQLRADEGRVLFMPFLHFWRFAV